MKNEKFCFSKGTGLIALVGVLLVGFVLLTQMTNQKTSLGSKAAPGPKHCYYATVDLSTTSTPYYYSIIDAGCIKDASGNNVGYRCNLDGATGALTGGSMKDMVNCPLPAAAARTSCFYGGQAMSTTPVTIGKYTYSVDANQCVVESGKLLGLKCDTTTFKVVADKTTCPAPAARTACQYGGTSLPATIGTQAYAIDGNGCITADAATIGYKCDSTTGFAAKKDTACAAPAAAARTSCFYGGQAMSTTPVTIGKYTYSVDANQCVVESGKLLGLKCDTTTFKVVADKTTCPAPAARTACQYGGTSLPATIGTQAYAIDGNGCITADAATIGYKCDSTTGFAAKKDTACAAPAAVARTTCYWGTQALSATAVQIGTEYYSLEAGTGCVLKATSSTGTAYNNGYKCDASTNYKSVKDSTTCRL